MKNKKLTMQNITVEEWNALNFDEMMEVLASDPDWKLYQKQMRWFAKEVHRRKELAKIYPDYPKEFDVEFAGALFFEAHPPQNKYTKKINENILNKTDKRYWTKWGECEICGYEGVLTEIGLNWTCDDPFCQKEMRDWYDVTLKIPREE